MRVSELCGLCWQDLQANSDGGQVTMLGKGGVTRIAKSRRYEAPAAGLRSRTALLVLREKIIRPLLAASSRPDPPSQANPMLIDRHYEGLRAGMRDLFVELGMVA
jgi:hypothetical protein